MKHDWRKLEKEERNPFFAKTARKCANCGLIILDMKNVEVKDEECEKRIVNHIMDE